jgi:hypothetical protein
VIGSAQRSMKEVGPTLTVRVLVGHFPGEVTTPILSGSESVTAPRSMSSNGLEIVFWPPYGRYWPPPGNSTRPDRALLERGIAAVGWDRADLYLQWGTEYRPLPVDIADTSLCSAAAIQIGDWNVAGRLVSWLLQTPEIPVLSDRPGLQILQGLGLQETRSHLPWGWQPVSWPIAPLASDRHDHDRDIDLLFVGSRNEAIHRGRERVLAAAASLASTGLRVVLATWLAPDTYRQLALRSRVMLNYSVRGEINLRTFEAIASGCVLMAEASNESLASALRPGQEYIPYDIDTLADTVISICNDSAIRSQVVNAAQSRLSQFSFERLLKDALSEHLSWLLDRGKRWDRARWDRSQLERQWLLTSDASCEAVDLYEHSANRARASLLTPGQPLSNENLTTIDDCSSSDRAPTAADLLVMAELASCSHQTERVWELAAALTATCSQGRFGNPATIPVPDFSWWRMSLETDLLEPGGSPERWLRSRAMWLTSTNLLGREPASPARLEFGGLSEVPELWLLAAAHWDAAGEHCAAAAAALRVHEISPRSIPALRILDRHLDTCTCLGVDLGHVLARHRVALTGLADAPSNDAASFLAHLDAQSDV